jgi:hypothetical protein
MKWRNIGEWIEEAHGESMMVEKEIDKIGRMERPRKHNEGGVNSRKARPGSEKLVEDG